MRNLTCLILGVLMCVSVYAETAPRCVFDRPLSGSPIIGLFKCVTFLDLQHNSTFDLFLDARGGWLRASERTPPIADAMTSSSIFPFKRPFYLAARLATNGPTVAARPFLKSAQQSVEPSPRASIRGISHQSPTQTSRQPRNATLLCDEFSGSDAGAKIAKCIAALPSTGGIADAEALEGDQAWNECPTIGVTKVVTLRISHATYTVNKNCIIPASVTLEFSNDGVLSVKQGSTLTVNGELIAPQSQHFAGPGQFDLTAARIDVAYPQWFGAVGDASAIDQPAFAAAVASARRIHVPCGTYALGFTGITIPSNVVEFDAPRCVTLTYAGTGTAVSIRDHHEGGQFRLSVKKTVADWDPMTGTGQDTTSACIALIDSRFVDLYPLLVANCAVGVAVTSSGPNTIFNNFYLGDIVNNKVGLETLVSGPGGAVNQNQFYNGSIAITGGHTTQLLGSRYISIEDGNGNTFIGTSLENEMPGASLYCAGSGNQFVNLRYEANQAAAILFTETSVANILMGGYFSSGTYHDIITDKGIGNMYISPLGLRMPTDVANALPLNFLNTKTGRNALSLTRATDGITLTLGNSTDGGTLATQSLTTNGYLNSGRAQNHRGSDVASSDGNLTFDSTGNFFDLGDKGTTINTITTAGWQGGSSVTLYFLHDVVVKNEAPGQPGNAPISLSGAIDFAAKAGSTLTLVWNDSVRRWVEIGRMSK